MNVKRIARVSVFLSALALMADGALAVETDPVVATVNGNSVRLTDIENARNSLPAKLQGAPLRDVYPVLLESLINSRLTADKAKKLGYHETPEFLHRMDRLADQILERMMLARHIEQNLTDEMIKERYGQVVEKAKTQFEVHARHILVDKEDEATALVVKLDDGADFATLAKEHSTGPSGKNGGDLGWFGPGQMVPAFSKAAMALPTGEFTKSPVKTQFGWHLILVEERRPFPIPSYQDAREVLAQELLAEVGRDFMTKLRGEAKIEKKSFEEVVKALQE